MARVKFILGGRPVFLASVFWLALLGVLHLWPASWWFDVRSVTVANAKQGGMVAMLIDRDIRRPFRGRWYVTLRQWTDGGWLTLCNATGASNYLPEARFPRRLDLRWWTDGQCRPLPPGRYHITTSWTIETPAFLPDKTITVDSNIFEVRL